MLSVRGLDQYYGGSHTLRSVDLDVVHGECTVVLGRNGVGKTTLLRSIMGIVPTRAGSVKYAGTELSRLPIERRARLGIGYVPQGREIFPRLTVRENVQVSLLTAGRPGRDIPGPLLELFPALGSMLDRRGGDLSGGQQQQLAILRALALGPKLLVLDEPTEGIQPSITRDIGAVLRRLNREQGLTVLLVEQKLHFAREVADRFMILDRGRSVAAGTMDELGEELVARHLKV